MLTLYQTLRVAHTPSSQSPISSLQQPQFPFRKPWGSGEVTLLRSLTDLSHKCTLFPWLGLLAEDGHLHKLLPSRGSLRIWLEMLRQSHSLPSVSVQVDVNKEACSCRCSRQTSCYHESPSYDMANIIAAKTEGKGKKCPWWDHWAAESSLTCYLRQQIPSLLKPVWVVAKSILSDTGL